MSSWSRRILIVDDDALLASLLADVLKAAGFEVEAHGTTSAARKAMTSFDPDLVILDVNLGGGPSGVQLAYVLRKSHPGTALLFLTRYPTALAAESAALGLDGETAVLSKDAIHDTGTLIAAVESALRGAEPAGQLDQPFDAEIQGLTMVQLEVLALVSQGLTNAAIAEARGTSERAVERHLKLIYDALGLAADRMQNARVLAAMRYERAMGLKTPLLAAGDD